MRGRRNNAEVVATELPVAVAPPQATNQFLPDLLWCCHEHWINMLLVAFPSERPENARQDGRIVSNVPALTGILCFVPSKAERSADNPPHIIPVVLLLLVKREYEATSVGGAFRKVVSYHPCEVWS